MNNKNVSITPTSNFSDEIVGFVKSNSAPKKLSEQLSSYHENDIALALPSLSKEECQKLFCILPSERVAAIIEYADDGVSYFELLGMRRKIDVLCHMENPGATELLSLIGEEERTSLIDLLPSDIRGEINLIRSFGDDEIGSKMSTNFIKIPDKSTVKQAMSHLIAQAAENDNISTLYLVDESDVFCGAISLKDLIIAREGTPISEITTVSFPYVYANAAVEDCVVYFKDYSEESIPVLNSDNELIGVVTAKDFAEILGDELGDDYAKLAGLSSEEDLSESVRQSVKKRIPWLCILLVLGLGVSAAVGLFESIVAQLPIIMCFQSLILDMAGNVGTQSLAVAIRVLMDTRIGRKHKAALVWKEARIGLLNGCILGLLSFGVIGGYLYLIGNTPSFAFAISGCLGVAMVAAMFVSSLFGTLIPIFFKRIGIDPAVASGPLITTVNDLVAVVSYYGLAWLILINIMHLV